MSSFSEQLSESVKISWDDLARNADGVARASAFDYDCVSFACVQA